MGLGTCSFTCIPELLFQRYDVENDEMALYGVTLHAYMHKIRRCTRSTVHDVMASHRKCKCFFSPPLNSTHTPAYSPSMWLFRNPRDDDEDRGIRVPDAITLMTAQFRLRSAILRPPTLSARPQQRTEPRPCHLCANPDWASSPWRVKPRSFGSFRRTSIVSAAQRQVPGSRGSDRPGIVVSAQSQYPGSLASVRLSIVTSTRRQVRVSG